MKAGIVGAYITGQVACAFSSGAFLLWCCKSFADSLLIITYLHTSAAVSTVLREFVDRCNEYGGQIPGAQGVPEEMIREATKYGICKVNIDTDLRLAMTAEIRRFLIESPSEFDPRKYLGPARDAIQRMVQHKIRDVLNASNTL